jgi:ribosomal protein S18 acetylase RimI-like enzyme
MPPDGATAVSGGFAIRPIEPREHAALGAITVAAYEATGEVLDADYAAELRDVSARAGDCDVLVAAAPDGMILGGVTFVPGPGVSMSELEHEDEAGIRMLAVDPAAQGLGVGRALTVACLDRARASGRTGVALFTRPNNEVAQRLYGSLGFVRDAGRDWEYEPGRWLWAFRLVF